MRSMIAALIAVAVPAVAFCQDRDPAEDIFQQCVAQCAEPTWTNDLLTRSELTGEWHGLRPAMKDHGITFAGNATQFYAGVTHGGQRTGWRYGGHNDYLFNIDMDKLAGLKGNFVKIRAEHRYGDSINRFTGALLPATIATDLPVVESEDVYLTNVLIMQFLSESFGFYFGKLDTLDGDMNAFAHGRGKTQFLNTSLITNPALLRVVPYSTLAAGALFVLGPETIINVGVLNATDTAKTTGFNELFNDGVVLSAEGRFKTDFMGMPGHQLIGGVWSSRDYTSLQQDPRILFPPLGIPIARQSDSWGLYYNFDQFLYTNPNDETKGWGVFGRFGITDGNPNPINWFLSLGLGGNSLVPGRDVDSWGCGWYTNGISDDLGPVATTFLGTQNGQGMELFYNVEVTPWMHLTSDIQYIHPSSQNLTQDAVVVGFRAKIDF